MLEYFSEAKDEALLLSFLKMCTLHYLDPWHFDKSKGSERSDETYFLLIFSSHPHLMISSKHVQD
jgi:hypothetical protein